MVLDTHFLIGFFAVLCRCTAMMMSAPLYGSVVPVNIRVLASVVISLALTPVVKEYLPPVPTELLGLFLIAGREVLFGLLIGLCMQCLLAAFQIAGAFLDFQLGLGSAQLFNPAMGMSTPLGQFKFWLGLVLIFLLNGHQLMFSAFVSSFAMRGPVGAEPMFMMESLTSMLGQLMLLAVQIGAPVIAVTVVIDVAAGLINKAVPQTQPFLISTPAKLALGLTAMSLGLPTLVIAVQRGLDIAFVGLDRLLGGV